ncbi:restriction endonuclease subunit S [Bacillus cereus]
MTEQTNLVPKRRFKEFQNTHAWEQHKLGDQLELENGYAFKSKYFQDETTKEIVLTPGNVNIGGGFQDGKGHYYDVSGIFPQKFVMKPGDIFVTMTDLTISAQALGFPAFIPNDGNVYLHNQRLGKLINYDGNKDFLFHLLCTEQYHKQIVLTASGTTVKHSSPQKILDCLVGIPSIEEQEKIGIFFRDLNNLITLHQRKLEKTKALKSAYLSEMFPAEGERKPKRRFAGFTQAWEQCKLGELGSVAMNKRIFKEQTAETGEVPFYKIGTFGGDPDAFISRELFEEYKAKYPYPEVGDILISASGSIGRTVEYTGEDEYFQDSNIVWLKHDERLHNSFLKQFYSIVKWQGLEGSTIKRLYNKNILDTRISVPSLAEQRKIGQFFNQLDNLITLHQRKLEKLQNIKKAYLNEMFV